MSSSYTKIYVHFIWGTWKRYHLIDEKNESILHRLIRDKLIENNCELIKMGCLVEHIHLLVRMHSQVSVSALAKTIKGYTSFTIANQIIPGIFFKWQTGYGAITVSPDAVAVVSNYIANQKRHHAQDTIDQRWELP